MSWRESLRAVATPLTASVDRVVARAITGRSEAAKRRSRAESLGHDERVVALDRITSSYDAGAFAEAGGFFDLAPEPNVVETPRGLRSRGPADTHIVDLSWTSTPPLHAIDPVLRERYRAITENARGHARVFVGRGDWSRPTAIIIHGYRSGQYAIEERVWPINWLLERGMNLALFVLPFHAVRGKLGVPAFPGSDPRFTNEGFRQAIFDLTTLKAALNARGSSSVGAMGMSLGGFTVSLWGTLCPLAFLAPVIPLASFADVAKAGGRLVGTEQEQALQHLKLEQAHRIISPFTRPSQVDPDAVIVVAGEGDRITPLAHAERLRDHYGAAYVTFPGGHLLQIGRSEGFRAIGRMLNKRGLLT